MDKIKIPRLTKKQAKKVDQNSLTAALYNKELQIEVEKDDKNADTRNTRNSK